MVASGGQVRHALLATETNTALTLSPDGTQVAFVRTGDSGPELWLRVANGRLRRLVTLHGQAIRDLRWSANGSGLIYRHAPRGREQWRLSSVALAGGGPQVVATGDSSPGYPSPSEPSTGSVTEYWLSPSSPGEIVFSSRGGGGGRSGLFRADLDAPAAPARLLADQPGFHRWLVDAQLTVRGGVRLRPDGSVQILLGSDLDDAQPVLTVAADDATDLSVLGFSSDGTRLFVLSSSDAATRALIEIDGASGGMVTRFAHDALDIGGYPVGGDGVWFDPRTGEPDIVTVMAQRLEHHSLGGRWAPVCAEWNAGGGRAIVDRSADDRVWLVVDIHDDGPIEYRLFHPNDPDDPSANDPGPKRSDPVLVNRPDLVDVPLAKLTDVAFTASDGQPITGYLMRPAGYPPGPLPAVVMIHGGPAGRDLWRFHAEAQYLATLGYLSLHINYRGSKGFGREFRRSGNGEWGGRMQQDLYDAVAHAIAAGWIDPDRVAFYGASYGGYAALLAACTRPDLVRCAVAVSPPCDLVAFTETPPKFWAPLEILLRRQVLGYPVELDPRTLRDRSPRQTLTAGCAPLLIATGVRDPRVPVAEVDDFTNRARALGVPLRYLRFADEGHHVRSNRNRAVLFPQIEAFLEEHIHGRHPATETALLAQ
jgi:dipeptidyl aminopeptidase/acylaminoacyl peptidase